MSNATVKPKVTVSTYRNAGGQVFVRNLECNGLRGAHYCVPGKHYAQAYPSLASPGAAQRSPDFDRPQKAIDWFAEQAESGLRSSVLPARQGVTQFEIRVGDVWKGRVKPDINVTGIVGDRLTIHGGSHVGIRYLVEHYTRHTRGTGAVLFAGTRESLPRDERSIEARSA